MNVRLVDEPLGLAELGERIVAAERVALDTEFHTEKHFTPRLMVVQVAFDDEVAIVDPLALGDLRPLASALARVSVTGHALSSDLRILAESFGALPQTAYDTQIAAAFCGYGLSISLLELVRDVAGVTLRKTQTVSDWSTRPLSARQIEYLVDDVRYLFPVADQLEERLAARGRRDWARDEMRALTDPQAYRGDRSRLYLRVAGHARLGRRDLAILNELAVLRERLARERNIPLKYILPDDVLTGLVALRPKSVDELGQLRRLDAATRRNFGAQIIEAVRIGEALDEEQLPPRTPRPLGPQRDAVVSAMALLVSALAAANEVPSSLLLSRQEIERIARELPSTPEALSELLDLSAWRRELLVEPLFHLLHGELAIRVTGYDLGQPKMELAP